MKTYLTLSVLFLLSLVLIVLIFFWDRPTWERDQAGSFSPLPLSSPNEQSHPATPFSFSDRQSSSAIQPSRIVYGRITDIAVKPLEGVLVTIMRMKSANTTLTLNQTTHADGQFMFMIDQSQSYTITAEKEGYITATFQGGFDSIDPILTLKQYEKLEGRVEDEEGKPVRFAKVSILSSTGTSHFIMDLQANQDGMFETREEVPSGTYLLSVSQDGYYDLGQGHAEAFVQTPPEKTILRLASKIFELHGRVEEYGTGNSVPGMRVRLWAWGFGGIYNGLIGEQTSDEKGNFHFPNLPPGEYSIQGMDPDENNTPYRFSENGRHAVASMRHAGLDSVVLYAAKTVEIRGTVVDEKQKPVSEVILVCIESRDLETITDAEGKFTMNLPQMDLGKTSHFRLLASQFTESGSRYAISEQLDSANGQPIHNVRLVLEEGITVKGQVKNRDGEPIDNAALRLKNQFTGETQEALSDANGRYDFSHVMTLRSYDNCHQFPYTLQVEAGGYAPALHFLVPLGGETELIHDVILDRPLSIAGRVLDSNRHPLSQVHIEASQPGCPGEMQVTNSEGYYRFDNLLPGKYNLLFQYTQRPMLTGYLWNVQAGTENADIQLTFQPIALNIQLDIHEEVDRAQMINGLIHKQHEDGSLEERNGIYVGLNSPTFSIMLWEAGTYQIRCYVPNCPTASARVVVQEQMEEDFIDITLPIGPPSPMNTLVGTIQNKEGFTCRFVQGPLQNQVPVNPDGHFRLDDIPDGTIDLVLWVFNNETGMPIHVDALIDRRIKGGNEINVGVIPIAKYLDASVYR